MLTWDDVAQKYSFFAQSRIETDTRHLKKNFAVNYFTNLKYDIKLDKLVILPLKGLFFLIFHNPHRFKFLS